MKARALPNPLDSDATPERKISIHCGLSETLVFNPVNPELEPIGLIEEAAVY